MQCRVCVHRPMCCAALKNVKPSPPNPYISETAFSCTFQKVYTYPPPGDDMFAHRSKSCRKCRKVPKPRKLAGSECPREIYIYIYIHTYIYIYIYIYNIYIYIYFGDVLVRGGSGYCFENWPLPLTDWVFFACSGLVSDRLHRTPTPITPTYGQRRVKSSGWICCI